MPKWVQEIIASVGIAASTIAVFAVAIALGVFAAIKIGEWNPWIAAAAAASVLVFIVLAVRLWWLRRRGRTDS